MKKIKKFVRTINSWLYKLKSQLAVPGDPRRTARLVAEAQSLVSTTRPEINDLKNEVRAEFADESARHGEKPPDGAVPKDESAGACRALHIAGVAVALFDVLCGAYMGKMFLNFEPLTAATIGIMLSLVICAVTAAGWHGILKTDPECPRKTENLLRLQLKTVIPGYLGCLVGCLLIGRIVSDATDTANAVFATLLTSLAVLGPMLLAVLLRLASELSWAKKYVIAIEQLCDLEMRLDELERQCQALTGPPDPTLIALPRIDVSRSEKPRLALATTTAIALLVGCGANAKASDGCGSLSIDSSKSVATSPERQKAAMDAMAALQSWAGATGCRDWSLFSFAGNAFADSSFYSVKIPPPPSGVCPAPKSKPNEMAGPFRGPAEAAKQLQQKRCQEYLEEESLKYKSAITAQINEARAKLAAYSPVMPGSTAIVDLLQRVRDSDSRSALLITDGAETAVPAFRGPIPAPSSHKTVVMVIISPAQLNGISPGQYFEHMRKVWLTICPWLSAVIPASRINENTFGPAPGQAIEIAGVSR